MAQRTTEPRTFTIMTEMAGLLVHGENHFIVDGPIPDRSTALELVRRWSVIQIGAENPPHLASWRIKTKEFRENLVWGVVVPGNGEISKAVIELLGELAARGIRIHDSRTEDW